MESGGTGDEEEVSEEDDRNAVEAGLARGILRSFSRSARSVARFPFIGRLPKAATTAVPKAVPKTVPRAGVPPPFRAVMPRSRVPVKNVARISDRFSQGWDLYGLARHDARWKLSRIRNFIAGLVKNTILGLVVFESYGAVIQHSASLPSSSFNRENSNSKTTHDDPYARATLPTHVLAGAFGGGAHGLLLHVWDRVAAGRAGPGSSPPAPNTFRSLLHHGTAHAVLFGTFEGSKRTMLAVINEDDETHKPELSSVEYLGVVAAAGGIAGQVQQWVSQYTEHLLIHRQQFARELPFRPALTVFLPSSIAFVAFEYGRYD